MHHEWPEAELVDVYKNFFQDYFGPGHLLSNTSAARKYLDYELNSTPEFGGPLFEATGSEGNFYRVNISLVSDKTIPYDNFFDAFVRSVSAIVPPSADWWRKTWSYIDGIIRARGFRYKGEEEDRSMLSESLAKGDFVFHHSDAFNAEYEFHYRIISREIFLKELLPLIEKKL